MYGMQMSYVILLPSLIESDIESIDHRSKGSKMVPFPVYYLYVYMLLTENNYYGLPPPPPKEEKTQTFLLGARMDIETLSTCL